ncbi:Zn-dependent protease [Nocardioides thalensis]|uniref:Zinc metalloprotease n=1 Tax=Nocardioides thalensis TaxID=1914755 RepID=A0A853C527_9ACTN|nr:site-2 protease family protein [Nocardioides thalensis]NYJ01373.1 Zn-dependent protease [Nocardioides thalensis]
MSGADPSPRRRTPVPPGTFRIGSIAGSDVLVSSSWFLVAALIAFVMAPVVDERQPGLGGWKYVVGVLFAVVLYLAVLLHEASHALVARRYGFQVQSITLHFLGGVTAIRGEARTPRQEFWIAVVGPLTSLGVGAAAVAVLFVIPDRSLLSLTVEGLAGANLLIGVLNLVPGLPLDGGRVLKAAVWGITGRSTSGTIAAGWGGRVAAVGVVAFPFVQPAVLGTEPNLLDVALCALIAAFLWGGASSAIATARIQGRLEEVRARDLARRTLAVPDDLPLAEAVRRAHEAGAGSIVTVTSDGRPVGVVNEAAVRATPADRQPWVAVSAVARTLDPGLRLPVSITGAELVDAIRATPASEYLLLDESGGVFGVLATSDVEKAVRAAR